MASRPTRGEAVSRVRRPVSYAVAVSIAPILWPLSSSKRFMKGVRFTIGSNVPCAYMLRPHVYETPAAGTAILISGADAA